MDERKISADCYTLKNEIRLKRIEENENLQGAISRGDETLFYSIMTECVEHPIIFGDVIRRYIFDQTGERYSDVSEISDDEMERFIKEAFRKNGMENRGSMLPDGTTSLNKQLRKWLESPVDKLQRNTIWLFIFGFNMDDEGAEYMLKDVLRQTGFNPRDYKEVIYYYCMKNKLQYAGVKNYLNIYEQLESSKTEKIYKVSYKTAFLNREMKHASQYMNEKEFIEYLMVLKERNLTGEKPKTPVQVLDEVISSFASMISAEHCKLSDEYLKDYQRDFDSEDGSTLLDMSAVNYKRKISLQRKMRKHEKMISFKDLYENMNRLAEEDIQIPEIFKKMVKDKWIQIPAFSPKSLEKKLREQTTEIKREDILMATFLVCTCGMGTDCEESCDYQERKVEFLYEANRNLEKCGFGDVYLLNPFELFLVACLLKARPMEYFLAVWKKFTA